MHIKVKAITEIENKLMVTSGEREIQPWSWAPPTLGLSWVRARESHRRPHEGARVRAG